MATAPGRFGLVHDVHDALTLLLTQAEQVRCLRDAAAHPEPGGRFVAEVFVPRLQWLPPGETARPSRGSEHHLVVDVYDEPPACAAPSGGPTGAGRPSPPTAPPPSRSGRSRPGEAGHRPPGRTGARRPARWDSGGQVGRNRR
jgi:hypothetical protein